MLQKIMFPRNLKTNTLILALIIWLGLHWVILPTMPVISKTSYFFAMFAITSMAMTFVLAARWRWIEPFTGGLDKSYRVHRWFGYLALIGVVAHSMIDTGNSGVSVNPLLANLGEEVGEFSMNMMLVLIALSAFGLLPYRWWRISHYAMGPVFFFAIFHSFFSKSPIQSGTLAWDIMAIASGLGTIAWVSKIGSDLLGKSNFIVNEITTDGDITEITLTPKGRMKFHHRAGQFAFLNFPNSSHKEAHPYTIASASNGKDVHFAIKKLGDYSSKLERFVKVGMPARIEGPYGRFTFNPRKPRQIWVAGGIGITPFIAFLEEISTDHLCNIDLIYCISKSTDILAKSKLDALSKEKNINLHYLISDEGKRLNSDWFKDTIKDTSKASFWYCGPDGLRNALEVTMANNGIKPSRLHYELFDMRGAVDLKARGITRFLITAVTNIFQLGKRILYARKNK